jgi:hypothetical protein
MTEGTISPVQIMPIAPLADVGSETLAAALETGDSEAISSALRNDFVVVPVVARLDAPPRLRLFRGPSGEEQSYDLCLFSSAKTYATFLGESAERDFTIRVGRTLVDLIPGNEDIQRVVLDPAGPVPRTASVETVLSGLVPQAGDEQFDWFADSDGDDSDIVDDALVDQFAANADSEETVVDFDLRLMSQWFRLHVRDHQLCQSEIKRLVDQQTRTLSDQGASLRADLRRWLASTAKRTADSGGRLMAFLLTRSTHLAFALSVVVHWVDVPPSRSGLPLLDMKAVDLEAALKQGDGLVRAQSEAGPLLRYTHVQKAPAEIDQERNPLLLVDYWLERPDRQGLVKISFSTPHVNVGQSLLTLTDTTVLNGAWVVERVVEESMSSLSRDF